MREEEKSKKKIRRKKQKKKEGTEDRWEGCARSSWSVGGLVKKARRGETTAAAQRGGEAG